MRTLRTFTKADWNCWSGCESEAPKICEIDESRILIVDGASVCYEEWDGDCELDWNDAIEFETAAEAEALAEAILAAFDCLLGDRATVLTEALFRKHQLG